MSDHKINKTLLNFRGYGLLKSEFDYKLLNNLRHELTVSPKNLSSFGGMGANVPSYSIYQESEKRLYIPKYLGLQRFGLPDKNKLKEGVNIDLKFNGKLRENQIKPVEAFLKAAKDDTQLGGLINLHCGGGKTCLSLYIISKLQKKTLVIVHKDFLLKQWRERIEQFLPSARVGLIKAKVIDIEDKDIVVGSLQSLSMKEYDKGTFDEFGFVIIDECFPYNTGIVTDKGVMFIGTLYNKWKNKEELPKILSYNKNTTNFEYKEMTYSWEKINKRLIEISMSKKKFKCTLNHKILTINGYIEANKLNIGDIIISKYDKLHIDNIIAPALNDDQLQIIYGSYLGDGHIDITKKNRYRLRIIHCEKQKDYCNWKAKMFGINNLNYIEKNGYSQKSAYSFQTKIFDLEYNIPKNTKEVPDWLLDKLDIKGISIWFMDDGSNQIKYNKNGTISNFISIHTNNFNYEIQ